MARAGVCLFCFVVNDIPAFGNILVLASIIQNLLCQLAPPASKELYITVTFNSQIGRLRAHFHPTSHQSGTTTHHEPNTALRPARSCRGVLKLVLPLLPARGRSMAAGCD